jgi:hypothetical protein
MTDKLILTNLEQIWLRENVLALLQDNIDSKDYPGILKSEFKCRNLMYKILSLDANRRFLPSFDSYFKKVKQ